LPRSAAPNGEALVALGMIVAPHGVRGEVKVRPYNPDSPLLADSETLWLRQRDGSRSIDVRGVRRQPRGLLFSIEGVDSREAADALRGAELCLARADFPEPEEGEHYLVDLLGLRAVGPDGEAVGEVIDTIAYPAADVLCVRTSEGVYEVPTREPYMLEVRLDQGVVVVDNLADLDPEPERG
jgi:16S rRNA processing protein RimM